MKADVKSSGFAASVAQPHQDGELGSSSEENGRKAHKKAQSEQAPQPVSSWASSYIGHSEDADKAVIVGPNATSYGLVSWATSHLEQLNVLLTMISCAKHEDVESDPVEFCGAIQHTLEQALGVLHGALHLIHSENRAASAKGGAA